ncbi:MAG: ribosomal-protein-alanine N-acetyltransferase [Chloroflexi bacterium]|nr:ribosomal-protein-alanine N-acetyltransferase [Chloroflexota bacterium]
MASSSVSVGSTNEIAVKNGTDASPNPYRARYASIGDAFAIDFVIKEAFGVTAPRSSAAREIKRKNTTYIVVTKDSQVGNGSDDVNNAMRMNWRRRLRSLVSVSVGNLEPLSDSRSIVGLVGIWTPVDQAHIMVIASRPSERRQGVGELLVIATLCEAVKIGATNVTLEVRKSNDAALTLYRKYGFSEIGIRRRYYSDNHEDAVIMATPSFANLDYIRSLQRRRDGYFMARGDTEIQVDPWQYLTLPE